MYHMTNQLDLPHELEILFKNDRGLRFTVFKRSYQNDIVTENQLKFEAKYDTNTHQEHSRLGPWEIVSSKWNS